MKCQIPLEVSFHRKASSSCEGGFSNSGLQRSEISSGRIKIFTPQPVLHLLPSQWLPLALYLTACVRYIFKPFFFSFGSDTESVAVRTVCFLLWERKWSGRAERVQRTLTQSLSICVSARVSATGHGCRNALVCSFNHISLLSIK